jgi:hypothetical protein
MAYLSGARGASVIDGKIPGFAKGGYVKGKIPKREDYNKLIPKREDYNKLIPKASVSFRPKLGKMSSSGVDALTRSMSSGATVTAKNALKSVMDKVGPINSPIKNQPSSVADDRPINITTGPVLEFDGKRYVTWTDFEKGLRDVKRQTLGEIRTAAGRKATGR